jgi:hypothetical protein
LDACTSNTAKLKAVKIQIRIYKIGWELEDADVAFSSIADPYIGTLEHLTAALKTILTAVDKKLKPPDLETITVSPSPISSLPPFGTLTVEVAKRREMNRWTKEQLCEDVQQAKVLIAEKQDKESGDAEAHKQPEECPDMTQLKSVFIDVLLEMQMPKDDGTNEFIFILFKHWCM